MTLSYLNIMFRSDFDVELVGSMGDDSSVVRAARVSTVGKNEPTKDAPGLIKYLMNSRHGSVFEHTSFTFFVSAPIFVFREFQRHRVASFSEESARYRQLKPVFYIPPADRPLVQIGTSAHPQLVSGSKEQYELLSRTLEHSYHDDYATYEMLLSDGITREISRAVLPGGIYSNMYCTMNARGLMNFLSLRVKSDDSTFPSNPQWEINRVADQMEVLWAEKMPITHAAFVAAGRVCP